MGLDISESVSTWQKAFLEVAPRFWPNISRICREVHIHRRTYYFALHGDKEFRQAIEDIDQSLTDEVEGLTANLALVPKHVIDRMAYLRARRPELYDRAKRIIVQGHALPEGEANRRSTLAEQVTDAEIVNAYWTRKERQALKQGRLEIEAETKSEPSSPQNPNP